MILKKDETNNNKWLSFELNSENYLVAVKAVREVINYRMPEKIPGADTFIEGMVTIRGDLMTVISGSKLFASANQADKHKGHIIVLDLDGGLYGLTVDQVKEILTINTDSIERENTKKSEFLLGTIHMNDHLYILTDFNNLCSYIEQ